MWLLNKQIKYNAETLSTPSTGTFTGEGKLKNVIIQQVLQVNCQKSMHS